mgnify:CR=1 FL=1
MWKKEKKQETQEVSPEKEEGRDLYEWAQALVCSVLAVVLLFTFVIRLIGVDGHSMVPTLQDGDRLLVLNAMLDNDYEYGDIVVLRKDTFLEEPIVKRVIATEGQTVDIDFVSGAVYVDGKTWTARSSDGTVLPIGTRVIAERMEGVKLYVKPEPISSTRQS